MHRAQREAAAKARASLQLLYALLPCEVRACSQNLRQARPVFLLMRNRMSPQCCAVWVSLSFVLSSALATISTTVRGY